MFNTPASHLEPTRPRALHGHSSAGSRSIRAVATATQPGQLHSFNENVDDGSPFYRLVSRTAAWKGASGGKAAHYGLESSSGWGSHVDAHVYTQSRSSSRGQGRVRRSSSTKRVPPLSGGRSCWSTSVTRGNWATLTHFDPNNRKYKDEVQPGRAPLDERRNGNFEIKIKVTAGKPISAVFVTHLL